MTSTNVPEYAKLNSKEEINYYCAIRNNNDLAVKYIRDKFVVIMINCNPDGSLFDLKKPANKSHPWIKLTARKFSINRIESYVPLCNSCNSNAQNISTVQTHSILSHILCIHSKVCSNIIQDFENCWSLDGALTLEPDEQEEERVEIFYKKTDKTTKTQHLAAVITNKDISILATVGRQTSPKCFTCSSPKCSHYRLWKEAINEGDTNEEIEMENPETTTDPVHYFLPERTYLNKSPIQFPLQRGTFQKEILDKKFNGTFTYPLQMIPDFLPQNKCEHGYEYQSNDESMLMDSPDIIVHTDEGSHIYPVEVFKRRSTGPCKCCQQVDGHKYLLFYVGSGSFVCYLTLNKWLLSHMRSGVTARSYLNTISDNCKTTGRKSSLKYDKWLEACDGFKANLEIDFDEAFTCIRCNNSPQYITCDGKALAPLKRKLKPLKLSELSTHPEDYEVMPQGSYISSKSCLFMFKGRKKSFYKINGR